MDSNLRFERAVATILKHEGGYIHDPHDNGGETKYGISKRSYPNVDIKNLTLEQAKAIYKRDFWDKYAYNNIIDASVATKVFDMSVNMGPTRAHMILQRALRAAGRGVEEDGFLGPVTLTATNAVNPQVLLVALKSEAAGFYRTLAAQNPFQNKFLTGWLNRAYV